MWLNGRLKMDLECHPFFLSLLLGVGYACPENNEKYAVKAVCEQFFASEFGDYNLTYVINLIKL